MSKEEKSSPKKVVKYTIKKVAGVKSSVKWTPGSTSSSQKTSTTKSYEGWSWSDDYWSDDECSFHGGSAYDGKHRKGKGNSSDYWRNRFGSYGTSSWSSNGNKKHDLDKCLYDVSRIANIYDPDVKIAYKSDAKVLNNVRQKTIFLDPRIAVNSELSLGKKVDIFAGEILLGSALRSNRDPTSDYDYNFHIENMKSKNPLVAAKSALFLAMEMNSAYQTVRKNTPGFKTYCYSRIDHLLETKDQREVLDCEFGKEEVTSFAKVSALVREIDTFNTSPLESYGDFSNSIEEVMEDLEDLRTSKQRLAYASEIASRYIEEIDDEDCDPDKDKDKSSKDGAGMISKSFLSGASLGEEEDEEGFEDLDVDEEVMKARSPEEIRRRRTFDGAVRKVEVNWTNDIPGPYGDMEYDKYLTEVMPIIESIIERLSFIDSESMCWEERSLRNGELDEGGLQKLALGSDRLFYKKTIFSKPAVQIGLLIDESGSMRRFSKNEFVQRYKSARKLTIAIANALSQIKGIDLFVFGHSGSVDCEMYEYITPNSSSDDLKKLSLIRARVQNYDSYAIKAAGERMLENSNREYSRRIMFVVSDGEPAGYRYGGDSAITHMKSISDWLREECGLEVYGVGIDDAYSEDTAVSMFGKNNNIVLPDFNISKVSNIISNFLEEVSKQA